MIGKNFALQRDKRYTFTIKNAICSLKKKFIAKNNQCRKIACLPVFDTMLQEKTINK